MGTFFDSALRTIPAIASSPHALVAYGLAVIAYMTLGWRVLRNRNLLANLHKLPPRDRAKVLQAEMNIVLPQAIGPEDWLRARLQRYYFLGFIVACATAILLLILVMLDVTGTIDIAADVYQNDSVPVGLQRQALASSLANVLIPAQPDRQELTRLEYEYTTSTEPHQLRPALPYLEALDGPAFLTAGLLDWDFPKISIKVVNNSKSVLFLNEVELQVRRTTLDRRAIPMVAPGTVWGSQGWDLLLLNEGWGDMLNPVLHFNISRPQECGASSGAPVQFPYFERLDNIEHRLQFSLRPYLSRLRAWTTSRACVQGEVDYETEQHESKVFRFATWSESAKDSGKYRLAEPSYVYDLFLDTHKNDYVVRKPIAQEIGPRAADHFVLEVAADRSATFDLSIVLHSLSRRNVWKEDLILQTIIPRYAGSDVRRSGSSRDRLERLKR